MANLYKRTFVFNFKKMNLNCPCWWHNPYYSLNSIELNQTDSNQSNVYRTKQGPQTAPGQFKYTVIETCERIKEEFNFIQSQFHRYKSISCLRSRSTLEKCANCCFSLFFKSLKMDLEKMTTEKTEMQRHYVMVIFTF